MDSRVFIHALVIFLVALAAGLAPLWVHWHGRKLRLVISLAAGIFFGAAFLHMIPEAAEVLGRDVGLYLLAGFLLLYLAENFLLEGGCEHGDCDYHRLGMVSFFGLSFHGLVEGVALGSSARLPGLMPLVFLAILGHKAPASFSLGTLLAHGNYSRTQVGMLVVGFAGMVPVGAGLALWLLQGISAGAVGAMVAVAAGTFLHIAADDMLPHVHQKGEGRGQALVALLLGIALMGAAGLGG
jgi:zinc and cadmium transporter